MTNNQLMHQYYAKCEALDITLETVKLFYLELCNEVDYNLYLHLDDEADSAIAEKFEAGMQRIMKYEPMNYVLGYSWFYGYKLFVDKNVLIPRYETEELVLNVLKYVDEYYSDYSEIKAVDIGTGSGAIAIALAKEEKRFKMMASDISQSAITVAKKNAEFNGLEMDFFVGNMLDPIIATGKKVDIILCNPPYIPSDEQLETSVVGYEPHVALFGGKDGLKYYIEVFENAKKIINPQGMLAFEIGWNQKEILLAQVKKYLPETTATVLKDINGKSRMLFIKF